MLAVVPVINSCEIQYELNRVLKNKKYAILSYFEVLSIR